MNNYLVQLFEIRNNVPVLLGKYNFFADTPKQAVDDVLASRSKNYYASKEIIAATNMFAKVKLLNGTKKSELTYNIVEKSVYRARFSVKLKMSFQVSGKTESEAQKYAMYKFENVDSGEVEITDGAKIDLIKGEGTSLTVVITTSGLSYHLLRARDEEEAKNLIKDIQIYAGEFEVIGKKLDRVSLHIRK